MRETESTPPREECIGYLEKGPHASHTWPYPTGGLPRGYKGELSRLCPGMTARDDDYTPEAIDRDTLPAELEEMVDDAVSRMKQHLEEKDREALDWLIGRMAVELSEAEAGEQHCVLITDPTNSNRQVVGPYSDRLHAKIACVLLKASYTQDDAELGNLSFEPIIFFPDPLKERVEP